MQETVYREKKLPVRMTDYDWPQKQQANEAYYRILSIQVYGKKTSEPF